MFRVNNRCKSSNIYNVFLVLTIGHLRSFPFTVYCLLFTVYCPFLTVSSVIAQPLPGTGHWQQFGLPDGLASMRVTTIAQDRQGYLWFGTDGWGVSRYDGIRLQTFTMDEGLPDNRVDAILEDQDGRLWVLTAQGACRYDGTRFQRMTIRRQDDDAGLWEGALARDSAGSVWIGTGEGVRQYEGTRLTVKDGLTHNRINAIVQDRTGALWIGTNGGLSRYADGRLISFTPENGLPDTLVTTVLEDHNGDLWAGTSRGAVQYDGRSWRVYTTRHGLAHNTVNAILEDQDGVLWFGTDGGVSRYEAGQFTTFTTEDGLVNNRVYAILEDHEGFLWFGADDGVSRYDRGQCLTLTQDDGIVDARVKMIVEDRHGILWFGTDGGGVMRYRNGRFTILNVRQGLVENTINSIMEDRHGALWFATNGGVSRYDPSADLDRGWSSLTTQQGLAYNAVNGILEDRHGALWFATNGGVSRYADGRFTTFTIDEGLAHNVVWRIVEDKGGNLWFGTAGGVSRYDGRNFTTLTTDDGLTHNAVWGIVIDHLGALWFATREDGVCRYDSTGITSFTMANGLAGDVVASILEDRNDRLWFGTNRGVSRYAGQRMVDVFTGPQRAYRGVETMLEDREGHIWLGTDGGGVIHYDGTTFQRLIRQDGLSGDTVDKLFQDAEGNVWIATPDGITRYRHRRTAPPVVLTGVMTDRPHGVPQEISLPSSQPLIRIAFLGISFKTRPDQMGYMYRLEGHDPDWFWTRDRQVTYTDLPRGDYVFRVRAVDRDLGTSEQPAEIRVRVHLPYAQMAYVTLFGLALLVGVFASRAALHRRRERDHARQQLLETQQQLVAAMERELRTAHDMQMSLLPQTAPAVSGFDIAGRCIPANHVGGDHYTYRWLDEAQTRLAIVIADVAGKEMKAAMTVMRFTEVLHYETQEQQAPAAILLGMNRSLRGRLEPRLYVTACIGVLDVTENTLTVSNAGHPPVYHRAGSDGRVTELECPGYPLGVHAEPTYETQSVSLNTDDVVVFYSDGIYEAMDHMGRVYGFDRVRQAIRRAEATGSAEEILDRILTDVRRFTGHAVYEDDMTLVVLKVNGEEMKRT